MVTRNGSTPFLAVALVGAILLSTWAVAAAQTCPVVTDWSEADVPDYAWTGFEGISNDPTIYGYTWLRYFDLLDTPPWDDVGVDIRSYVDSARAEQDYNRRLAIFDAISPDSYGNECTLVQQDTLSRLYQCSIPAATRPLKGYVRLELLRETVLLETHAYAPYSAPALDWSLGVALVTARVADAHQLISEKCESCTQAIPLPAGVLAYSYEQSAIGSTQAPSHREGTFATASSAERARV